MFFTSLRSDQKTCKLAQIAGALQQLRVIVQWIVTCWPRYDSECDRKWRENVACHGLPVGHPQRPRRGDRVHFATQLGWAHCTRDELYFNPMSASFGSKTPSSR